MFDEKAEYDQLIDQKGQIGTMKPGVTRGQLKRYFKRRDAALAARWKYYQDGRTAAGFIDRLIEMGCHYHKRGRYHYMRKEIDDSHADEWRLRDIAEWNYAMVQLDVGNFAKNY